MILFLWFFNFPYFATCWLTIGKLRHMKRMHHLVGWRGESDLYSFFRTRSYAALRAADLDWIVGPGYSLGGYVWGVLNVSFRASGIQLGFLYYNVLFPYFVAIFTYFSLTVLYFWCTFGVNTFEIMFIFGKQYPWSRFPWLIKCHLHETTLKNHGN